MKLRPEFESLRATLLNQDSLQLEGILANLIREETRLRTQAAIDAHPGRADAASFSVFGTAPSGSSLPSRAASGGAAPGTFRSPAAIVAPHPGAVHSPPAANNEFHDAAFAAYQSSPPRRRWNATIATTRGHTEKFCRKRNLCVYCKKCGHIISDCELLPERMGEVDNSSSGAGCVGRYDNSRGRPRPAYAATPATHTDGVLVTPAALESMVNKDISSGFASLQATCKFPKWIIDSACFNHMTGDRSIIRKDMKTGRELGKDRKQGRIFMMDELITPSSCSSSDSISVSRVLSFPAFSSLSDQKFQLWHARLGYPNSGRLVTMFRQ